MTNQIAIVLTVGAFDAKTHLSGLLDKVEAGQEVIITRHGKPVARLVGAASFDRARAAEAIARLRQRREGMRLDGLSWKELRDAGRK